MHPNVELLERKSQPKQENAIIGFFFFLGTLALFILSQRFIKTRQSASTMNSNPFLYGLLAEFDNADKLVAATQRAHDAGYRKIDAYTPYPVEGLAEALGFHRTWVPPLVLLGGIIGAVAGYALQYYAAVIAYPVNVGGRPLNTWPMFVPVTFETTILFAAIFAVLSMFALNGLPMPYHPLFNVPRFDLATRDRFFLVVHVSDPKFDLDATRKFLMSLGAQQVFDVPQ